MGTGSVGNAVSCGPRTAKECRPYLGQTNLEADDVLMRLFFDQRATAGLIDCPLSDSAMLGRDRSPLRSADRNGVPFLLWADKFRGR